MRSNRVRSMFVALAAGVLVLAAASSAAGVSDLTVTPRSITAADNSLTIAMISPGNAGSIHGNVNYWTSPIDGSGTFEWFNKPVEITDFALPDVGNGVPTLDSATFSRNIGAGYSAPAPLAGPPYVLADDGVYSIAAAGTDAVLGTVVGEIVPAFGVDQTDPMVTSNVLPFYAGTAVVTLSATDTASGVENMLLSYGPGHINESWEPSALDPANFSVDLSLLGEGMQEIHWTAFDNAGNMAHGMEMFTIDNTAPSTVSDAVAVYNGAASIHLTATDNSGGSGVAHTYYMLDGAPQVEGTVINVPAPVNGSEPHTLEFWSEDAVGNVESPHITQNFTVNSQHTVTATAGLHGSISPVGAVVVNLGAGAAFSITPDSGYRVASVMVDGVSVGAVTGYTFLNVTANHTIAATFAVSTKAPSTTTIRVGATSILYGSTVRVFGTVAPNASGGLVTIQRRIGTGAWVNMTTAPVSATSAYTRTISKMSRGTWYFRTVYAGTATVAGSTSAAVRVIVR